MEGKYRFISILKQYLTGISYTYIVVMLFFKKQHKQFVFSTLTKVIGAAKKTPKKNFYFFQKLI